MAAGPQIASAGVAGLQDDRLSSVPEDQIQERLNLLEGTGARVTRIDVLWSDIAPTKPANDADPFDPAYKFSRLDQTLAGLASRNIVPILAIYSAPSWATGGKGALSDRTYNANTPDPAAYGRFVGTVLRRYNGFVNPSYAAQPRARHIEVWNEPNLSRYYVPQFDKKGRSVAPRNYMRLVKAAYTNAKAANPRSVVIAGVVGPKSSTKRKVALVDQGHGALDWIRAMVKLKGQAKYDAFSQHIYPAQPPKNKRVVFPNWASLPLIIKEVDKIRPGMRVYVTEAGYTTKSTPIRTSSVTEAQQATYLRHIMNLPVVRSKRVPVVIWFNMQDNPLWPAGLYREDLSAKPSWAVFKGLAGRDALPNQLLP